jgi:lysophospholipase L1-like esterase
MTQPLSRKLLISLATSVILLGSAECALRLYGFKFKTPQTPLIVWNPEADLMLDKVESLHAFDAQCLWVPRAKAEIPWEDTEQINQRGYRGSLLDLAAEQPPFRVAYLGDSSTFGWRVKSNLTFAERASAALHSAGTPTETLNAGVIGYSIAQGLSRYQQLVRPHKPDAVVISFGAVNEHLNGPNQKSDSSKLKRTFPAESWSERIQSWCRSSSRVLQYAAWLRYTHSNGELQLRKELRESGRKEFTDLVEIGRRSYQGVRRVSLAEYSDLLDELVKAVRLDGAEPVLISMPRMLVSEEKYPVLCDYSEATQRAGERLNVPVIDARDILRSYTDLYPPEKDEAAELALFFDYWHPRPIGHQLIADALKPHLIHIAQQSGHAK